MKMTIDLPLTPIVRTKLQNGIRHNKEGPQSIDVANKVLLADLTSNISVANVSSVVLEDEEVVWYVKMLAAH